MDDEAVDQSSVGTSSQSKKRKIDEKITIINDPIWGPIELDPLCMKIINTPQFQRLRNIKQLGGCSFVYPGACHSRFEHSIGTAHLARIMGEELQKKHTNKTITDQEILCLEVAGLCHDLGHGPFSHLFDQQFQNKCKDKKWTHEDLSIRMLDKVFETLNRSVDLKELIGNKGEKLIKDLIEPSRALRKEKPFLYEIISNEENKIDVDKWDYFSRDCHMLGLHHNFQCQRSIKLSRIVDNHISFPKSEYFNLFDMFYTRFTLHRRAYQHPVAKAVEMMIADAFLKADKYLTFLPVRNPGGGAGQKRLSESMDCMDTYQGVTDDVLQQIRRLELDTDKKSDKHKDVKAAQDIIDRIYCRDLYKLIGEKRVKWDPESIKALNIADKLKAFADSLKQPEMTIGRIKNDITEILKSNPIPAIKSEIENIATKLTTHVDSLKQSATETVSLKGDVDEILKTYQVPKSKDGSLKNYIAEKLKELKPSENFEIEVVEFTYGSGRKNPMEKVKFHKKNVQPDHSQQNTSHGSTDQYESVDSKDMDEKKSDMIPTIFEQIYVRLYWKGQEKESKLKEELEKTFIDIKEFECGVRRMYKGKLVNI